MVNPKNIPDFFERQGEMRPWVRIAASICYWGIVFHLIYTLVGVIGGTHKMLCASSSVPENIKIEAKCPER